MDAIHKDRNGPQPASLDGLLARIRFAIREGDLTAFLVLALLITAFRLVALAFNGTDLYVDEAQYWTWSRNLALGYFSKPPLIAWIIHGATTVCGHGETCVRLPSVALHLVTTLLVYFLGRRLYSPQVGFWSGLAYALLPAVSLSSGIISTDVPLLAAWALALFAFTGLLAAPSIADTLLLALALGLGLNAKYAMAYFVLCAAIYFLAVPDHRDRLKQPHLWVALAGGLALITPNILWNVANGFVTFSHTADNAKWSGIPFHPDKAGEFFLAQFGVFGPILFGAFLVILWRTAKTSAKTSDADKLLIAFSVPIIALVTAQGLASRAHANWAAPAYVAAVVLVTATMLRNRDWSWMRASFALHAIIALLLAVATWQAGRLALPVIGDPFARTLGNRELAEAVKSEIAISATNGQPIGSILTDDRDVAAALTYYARDAGVQIFAWRNSSAPRSQYEIENPFSASSPMPALLVSPNASSSLIKQFGSVTAQRTVQIPAGNYASRRTTFAFLTRFRAGKP
ncbi:ArnT family glycosyltransferase [Hyphomicrobium sp.]|uniref:ArnT family glycosyltransferase n=1 Tax=Hyphomicrobium sp. TaxID=82 RepID=UPI002E2F94C3|nr:glycosyltransferase family 39 protein [Hyphomicrobium sp.]HEX2842188.1 glycosyltransferase family 39 protein [Hyphomicrobium sp.]